MNNQRPYAQPMARPSNQAGPTIRAGLSVQELKAMTAMRVAHDSDSPNPGINPRDMTNTGPYRNPASSYQTATPQQLQAAGIAPVVINERPALRQQKPSNQGSYASYASSNAYGEQDLVGQNRPYSYDDGRGPATGAITSSYAKASSTAGVTPALSAYHQQILPNRSNGPQINSVEDVKEMTRLRMLMAERDAFFESSTSGRTQGSGNGGSNPEHSLSGSLSNGGPHSDFDGPFEETQSSRYASRFGSGPSVNNSTDSFDSYDFPGVVPPEARARGLQPSHAQSPLVGGLAPPAPQKSLYAPPSQQHQFYNEYASNPSSAGSSSKLSQSSSMGGLGLGLGLNQSQGNSQRSGSGGASGLYGHTSSMSELSSPLGGPLASPAYGRPNAPNVGGARSQIGLGLAGSSVVGRRAVGAPLAPMHGNGGQYNGYPVERGIERNLMLNAQLTGHVGLTGGIDRLEQSLNGLGSSSYHDDLLPPAYQSHLGLSASNSSRLTSGGTGLSPTTHSSRSSSNSYMSSNQNNNNSSHNNSGNFLYGNTSGNNSTRDMSLNALLGDSSPYTQFNDPQTPLPLERERELGQREHRDNLYDLLSDPIGTRQSNAASNTNNILSTLNSLSSQQHHLNNNHNNSHALLDLQVTTSPQKILLGPLSGAAQSPTALSTTSSSNGVVLPAVDSRVSPRTLAPLGESPGSASQSTKSPAQDKDLPPGVRKLSLVGKAATYNDAVSPTFSDKSGSHKKSLVALPELDRDPSNSRLEPLSVSVTSAPTRHNAFGDHSSTSGSSASASDLALGIASPENSEMKAHQQNANSSTTPGSASNKRFPLMKASTTSRIPDNASPGTRSPSHKMLFSKNANNNRSNNDYTPPGTAGLDRAASDSTNMNFLASEMAEMVLDTPYRMGHGPTHSRDNSSDLSRLLAAINNSGSDVGDNSLPSVTSKSFKRIPSISSFLGFD